MAASVNNHSHQRSRFPPENGVVSGLYFPITSVRELIIVPFYGLMSHNRRDFSLRKNWEAEDMKRKMYARLRAARSEVTAHYG